MATTSSDKNYTEMKAEQEDPNKIEVDLVTGCFYNNMKKLVKTTFHEFYTDILTRISTDYGIDLDELKESYPMEVKVVKKKKRDPAQCCLATIKKTGLQCGNSKKEGHNYCGTHLRSKDAPSNTYADRGKTGPSAPASSNSASARKKLNLKATYVPREETPEEASRRDKVEEEHVYQVKESDEEEEELMPEPVEVIDGEEVDVEEEVIEGQKYIVCDRNIYRLPIDGIGEMGLDELEFVGLKQADGTYKWK